MIEIVETMAVFVLKLVSGSPELSQRIRRKIL